MSSNPQEPIDQNEVISRLVCPRCGSIKTNKNGYNYLKNGQIRLRYYCQHCGRTFRSHDHLSDD